MPTLNGKLLDENCPDCFSRGKVSKLVEVTQDWDMEEEGSKAVVLNQCPCGYKVSVFDEMPLLHEPSQEEIKTLRGERAEGYKVASSFSWVYDYFRSFARI